MDVSSGQWPSKSEYAGMTGLSSTDLDKMELGGRKVSQETGEALTKGVKLEESSLQGKPEPAGYLFQQQKIEACPWQKTVD